MNAKSEAETVTTLRIADDFSRTPAGRYRTDGPRSGECFRDDYLLPLLRDGKKVVVELDGVEGYGSSFLEEVFGGLVRVHGFDGDRLHELLDIHTRDRAWKMEIWEYIDFSETAGIGS